MQIEILQLLDGARNAKGLTVIIDVFRAFSVACYAFEGGVQRIYPVGNIEDAYQLKEQNPDFLLVGERNEQKPEGFDCGNSPSQLLRLDIAAKTMVHTTSSGTQGIANALQADELITGSFVNAGAIINYIRKQQPEQLSLVCMGYACSYPTDEDTFLAEYIKAVLEEKPVDFEQLVAQLRLGAGARFFEAEKQSWSPTADFDLCLQLNRFDFVLKVEQERERNYLKKIEV
ncbi:2-phosphosulfolactate phosphatase [Mangrovibacterium lignilyticum]|uniref:2-phosphosulfolactate phosphatase n=1 Tax=Mangrovibacterium lignilyticum TaxID=2668052 RepID=UPI0013CFBDA3|nr:2-phosphosulfolactate phosphatase [Mangrovibacterium lignilyticum]